MWREKETWLIDIGSTHLKMLNLRLPKVPRIESVKVVDYYRTGLVNRPEDLSQLILTQILRDTVRSLKISGKTVGVVISTPGALVRILNIPLVSMDELKATIQFNLIGLIPYDPEKAEFDFTIWETNPENRTQTAIVSIAPTTEITWITEIITRAGLEPVLITIDALAIFNALSFCPGAAEHPTLLLHIGARKTNIIYHDPGNTPFFHIVPFGGEHITQQLARLLSTSYVNAELIKLGELNLPEPKSENINIYHKALNQAFIAPILPVVQDILINQQLTHPADTATQIILTGGGALTPELDVLLAQSLKQPVQRWNLLDNLPAKLIKPKIDPQLGWQLLPLIGLACQEGLCG